MKNKRLGVGVAVTGGCLYAVGGSDGVSPLSSVERYNNMNRISLVVHKNCLGLIQLLVSGVMSPLFLANGSIWVWLFFKT